MSERNDGGPAFPRPAFAPEGVTFEDCVIHDHQDGMSMRDWFAGQALLLAGCVAIKSWEKPGSPVVSWTIAAEAAYKMADAMLDERYRKPRDGTGA